MESKPANGLALMSPAFQDGAAIPEQYSCRGPDINPPLTITGAPAGAQSFTLIMHDPDAPGGDYLHWLMWDIPPSTNGINVNSAPVGAIQGYNSSGKVGYMGPCPPSGTHHYIFDLYALDKPLDLKREASRDEVLKAMEGHTLAQTTLTGLFSAK